MYSLKIRDSDSIIEYLSYFNTIIGQLASIEVNIEDDDNCILILCSVIDSSENLIIVVDSGGIEPKMDNIIPILSLEEMRRKTMNVGSQDALHFLGMSKEKEPKGDKICMSKGCSCNGEN